MFGSEGMSNFIIRSGDRSFLRTMVLIPGVARPVIFGAAKRVCRLRDVDRWRGSPISPTGLSPPLLGSTMNTTRTPAQLAVSAARAAAAQKFAESMREPLMAALANGAESDREIAAFFNRKLIRTRTHGRWTAISVSYLRSRLGLPQPGLIDRLLTKQGGFEGRGDD